MTAVESIDARSGEVVAEVAAESTAAEVTRVCALAAEAAPALDALGRSGRAALLRTLADGLEDDRSGIVEVADRESGLGETRLSGELTRTAFQLRLFAEVLDEGSYLEAIIDHAVPTPMGPRPDLRRMLVPLGPVAVFGASNFPLAFSVAGGDTASALAAGCPVIVKAHPSHPATSVRVFEALTAAAAPADAPRGMLGLVHGYDAGIALVTQPAVRAVGFTGSLHGGRALHELAAGREDPIPFYGELSSINPLVVTPGAAAERGEEIGRGVADSFTLGAGQFCTKPGLVLLPVGLDGDRVRDAAAEQLRAKGAGVPLNRGIGEAYARGVEQLSGLDGMRLVAESGDDSTPAALRGALFETGLDSLERVAEECFGPTTVLVRYASRAELLAALPRLPAALTATVHAADGEDLGLELDWTLRAKVGRVVWNGYPTGVAVSWAMQHGGPWPATTSLHTSVGATAIRRFLRPVAWQDAPEAALPVELRDGPSDVPRRVDGVLTLPAAG